MRPNHRERSRPAGRGRRLAARLLIALLAAAALLAGWQIVTWPDVAALARENPRTTAFIERERAVARAEGREARILWVWVPYEGISPHLKRAVLVAEDINFFSHNGFEIEEIRTAVQEAMQEGKRLRGASTITQQLAKNLWLSPSRNPARKLREALLTVQLERRLSKKRILELYLNVVAFRPGTFGAEAAAQRSFGKPASALGELEAAQLAAGIPRPSTWHPGSTSPAYRERVESILRRMARAQFLWKHI
jgi:monofunctional biosynthetic peptidoglycan transglycosylase